MYENESTEQNQPAINAIPLDLFSPNQKKYDLIWSRRTYQYAHLFDKSIKSRVTQDNEDLINWINIGIKTMKKIKDIGKNAGEKQIISLAKNHFKMKLKVGIGLLVKPTSLNDILQIIGDKEWYQDDKDTKLNILYNIIYGLTRRGMNGWLLSEESKWLEKHNLVYDTVNLNAKRKTRLKGFVYSLMNCMFSNSTINFFKICMIGNHGEFITIRDKPPTKERNNKKNIKEGLKAQPNPMYDYNDCVYTPHKFAGGSGYIVKVKETQQNMTKHKQLEPQTTPKGTRVQQ